MKRGYVCAGPTVTHSVLPVHIAINLLTEIQVIFCVHLSIALNNSWYIGDL
jgi:hypothetical protein